MGEEVVVAESDLAEWALVASDPEALWASRPAWRPEVSRALVGCEHVVWSSAGFFGLEPVAAAVADHFDGTVTVSELAADLAAAADSSLSWARSVVATLVIELTSLRAIDGAALPEAPSSRAGDAAPLVAGDPQARPLGESFEIDPDSGAEMRVVTEVNADGNLMTVEYLPDGRVRTSTTMRVAAPPRARGQVGDPSSAELAPVDSCMGSRLRNFDAVPLVSFESSDGILLSVRCHSTEVANILRLRAGDNLTPLRGPIEAFVVTPLEGDGPLRTYDGLGRRRGRPRSPAECADVVEQILGERLVQLRRSSAALAVGADRPLGLVLLTGPQGASALVPPDLLDDREMVGVLRRAGVALSWAAAHVDLDGRVVAPNAFDREVLVADSPYVIVPHGTELFAAQRVHALLGESDRDEVDRQTLLDHVAILASRLRWRSLGTLTRDQLTSLLTSTEVADCSAEGTDLGKPASHRST